jgi:peptide/nickel transport system permease protein
MLAYILRRVLYAIPILICVNVLTFILFFFVNSPDDVAHVILGDRHTKPADVFRWKRQMEYHLPRMINTQDRILYVGKEDLTSEAPPDITGYKVSSIHLDEGDKSLEANQQRLAEVRKSMRGNEVVLVNPTGLTKETAGVISGELMGAGMPMLLLNDGTEDLRQRFDETPWVFIDQPTDLQGVVDQLQSEGMERFTETLFFKKSMRLFWFDFGKSDRNNISISYQILDRMGASLSITVPAFFLGMILNLIISMLVAYCRGTYIDKSMLIICIMLMSINILFYIFGIQLYFGRYLMVAPVSGFPEHGNVLRFVMLPILIAVIADIGPGVRFYRTVFLEEINKDYVRTARAKGVKEHLVLFKHVLRNSMLPILTNTVTAVSGLFIGSLLLENFFSIPGLGDFTLTAIWAQDFRIVGSMVYLGAFMYVITLVLTDISYTIADPRVRLE